MRILKVLLVLAPCVTVLGFYGGWFPLPTYGSDGEYHEVDVSLTSGPDILRDEAGNVTEPTTDLAGQVTAEVGEFGDRAINNVKSDDE